MAKNTGQFQKGKSGNPTGRPKRPEIEDLREAIEQVQKKQGKSLLVHFVEQAYQDKNVLIALGKKIIPDLTSVDGKQTVKVQIGAPEIIFGSDSVKS